MAKVIMTLEDVTVEGAENDRNLTFKMEVEKADGESFDVGTDADIEKLPLSVIYAINFYAQLAESSGDTIPMSQDPSKELH